MYHSFCAFFSSSLTFNKTIKVFNLLLKDILSLKRRTDFNSFNMGPSVPLENKDNVIYKFKGEIITFFPVLTGT